MRGNRGEGLRRGGIAKGGRKVIGGEVVPAQGEVKIARLAGPG